MGSDRNCSRLTAYSETDPQLAALRERGATLRNLPKRDAGTPGTTRSNSRYDSQRQRGRNELGARNSDGFDYRGDRWIREGRGAVACRARLPRLCSRALGGEARSARCVGEGEET